MKVIITWNAERDLRIYKFVNHYRNNAALCELVKRLELEVVSSKYLQDGKANKETNRKNN